MQPSVRRLSHVFVVGVASVVGASCPSRNSDTALIQAARACNPAVVNARLAVRANVQAWNDQGETALMAAACDCSAEVLEALLEARANVHTTNTHGDTALIIAAEENNAEALKTLLAANADASASNKWGDTALFWAAWKSTTESVKVLVAHGADVLASNNHGDTALIEAARSNHTGILILLLQAGADVHAVDVHCNPALLWAAWKSTVEAAKALLAAGADVHARNKHGDTALLWAARNGRREMVKVLLARGANPKASNNDGVTPLIWAAMSGYDKIVMMLVAAGAEPRPEDMTSKTALIWAAVSGYTDVAKALGADEGITELMIFAVGGHVDKVRQLGTNPAELKRRDKLGRTVLMWAAMGGDIEVTRELLRLHVSKYARDAAGLQARDFAMVGGHHSLLEELPTTPLQEHCRILLLSARFYRVVLAVCATVLAACIYACMQRSSSGGYQGSMLTAQSPSRGAILVAGKKHSSCRRQWAAKAFRFLEVFCNSVIPMGIMLRVSWEVWLPVLALAYILPAVLWSCKIPLLQEPLAVLLVSTHQSVLWDVSAWPRSKRAATILGIIRLLLLIVLGRWASEAGAGQMENVKGMEVTTLLQNNWIDHACSGFNLENFVSRPWHVASGECTMDDEGCITSPNFPRPYPKGSCTIDVDFPFFVINATDFWTEQGYSKMSVGRFHFTGPHSPDRISLSWHIVWNAREWKSKERKGSGWRICPGQKLCLSLPPVRWTWWLLQKCAAGLAVLWWTAAVALAIVASFPGGSAPMDVQMVLEDAEEVDRLIAKHAEQGTLMVASDYMEELTEHGKPMKNIEYCPPGGVYGICFMLILDVLLDLNMICTLFLSEHILFAGCILASTLWTVTTDFATGAVCTLPNELRQTLKTGVPTDGFLHFLDRERGNEALVSLFVTSYALPFATRTPWQMLTGALSILTSAWGVSMLVHEKIDLAVQLGTQEQSSGGPVSEGDGTYRLIQRAEEASATPLGEGGGIDKLIE